jgi:S1-C subfamily serine protease
MKQCLQLVVIGLLNVCLTRGATHKDLQSQMVSIAPTASDAVIPISYWTDVQDPQTHLLRVTSGVLGTGFLIDEHGDFVTAAHVVKNKDAAPREGLLNWRLTAVLRQKSGDGAGMPFSVIETDLDHDLALCHIDNFHATPLAANPLSKMPLPTGKGSLSLAQMVRPFASLGISKRLPAIGHLNLVCGFPLGSWTPTVQLGLVSALETVYPPESPVHRVPKDSRELLQISVNANHGNSGGPVIDLQSGEVLGVILEAVPAPLQIQGLQLYDQQSFAMSGITLAAPASWINRLLEKHKITSRCIRTGRLTIW